MTGRSGFFALASRRGSLYRDLFIALHSNYTVQLLEAARWSFYADKIRAARKSAMTGSDLVHRLAILKSRENDRPDRRNKEAEPPLSAK